MPTGAKTGLLVIDTDPRNGGDDSEEALICQHGAFPETAEAMTGGGGRHRFYRYPGGPVPKELAKGVDLKGDRGYVLVDPSCTVDRYQFDGIAGAKALLNPANAPGWVINHILTAHTNGNGKHAQPI